MSVNDQKTVNDLIEVIEELDTDGRHVLRIVEVPETQPAPIDNGRLIPYPVKLARMLNKTAVGNFETGAINFV